MPKKAGRRANSESYCVSNNTALYVRGSFFFLKMKPFHLLLCKTQTNFRCEKVMSLAVCYPATSIMTSLPRTSQSLADDIRFLIVGTFQIITPCSFMSYKNVLPFPVTVIHKRYIAHESTSTQSQRYSFPLLNDVVFVKLSDAISTEILLILSFRNILAMSS